MERFKFRWKYRRFQSARPLDHLIARLWRLRSRRFDHYHVAAGLGGPMSTRREFLITTSSAALGATLPGTGSQSESLAADASAKPVSAHFPYSTEELFESG